MSFRGAASTNAANGRGDLEPVDPLAALGRASIEGDRQAQRTLIVALGPTLLRAVRGVLGARHPDVEDVLQEAMTAVLSALPAFRGECQTVHFACRVAVQTAMNARRRASYRLRYTPSATPDELAELARHDETPAEACAAAARREALRNLLDGLSLAKSEVLVLHTILGYSIEETARATRVPVNTVRSRLRSALAALRSRVNADRALLENLGVSS